MSQQALNLQSKQANRLTKAQLNGLEAALAKRKATGKHIWEDATMAAMLQAQLGFTITPHNVYNKRRWMTLQHHHASEASAADIAERDALLAPPKPAPTDPVLVDLTAAVVALRTTAELLTNATRQLGGLVEWLANYVDAHPA